MNDFVQVLLELTDELVNVGDGLSRTPLHTACGEGRYLTVFKLSIIS
jgi:ankyrin repeat protein